jgi:uncharacterized protein (DUF934 family)
LVIAPGETLTLPQNSVDFQFVYGPGGLAETQLIFSIANFTQTLAAMHPSKTEQIGPLLNPMEVAQAVLQDLHNASAIATETLTSTDTYALEVNAWASLSFIYQVR